MYQILEMGYKPDEYEYNEPEWSRTLPTIYKTKEKAEKAAYELSCKSQEEETKRLEEEGYLSPEYDCEWVPDYANYYEVVKVEAI